MVNFVLYNIRKKSSLRYAFLIPFSSLHYPKHSMNRLNLIAFLFFFFSISANAQNKSVAGADKKISWKPVYENKIPGELTFRSLDFEGASFNEDLIPVFVETLPLPPGAQDINVELVNVQTETLSNSELVFKPENIGTDFKVSTQIVSRRKSSSVSVTIVPIRKNGSSFEKLVSFDLNSTPVPGTLSRVAPRLQTRSSVLSSGTWYKLGVVQNGVHKISYQQLKDMGVDVDNIDPRSIRLYGNGGGQLPYANNVPRADDLLENAIQVSGENDGVFNSTDFILFYGTDQTKWTIDPVNSKFSHQLNGFSDTSYYFLTSDLGTGKRIQTYSSGSANIFVSSFDDRQFHEAELVNLLKSGREWYGENFDNLSNSRTFSFSFPNIITSDTAFIKISLLGRSMVGTGTNAFRLSIANLAQVSQPFSIVGPSAQDHFANSAFYSTSFNPPAALIPVGIQFTSPDPNGLGWVNYIELNARRYLDFAGTGSQLEFRDTRSVGPGNLAEYLIRNSNSSTIVWDITDRTNVSARSTQLTGSDLKFTAPADDLKEYIAFSNNSFYTPSFSTLVENQNLHGLANANMIIVTNPAFLSQSNEIAEFHRQKDNLSVIVATTQQIFNEFASGSQDVCAIRDFVKMFYDRALSSTELPKFLLLMGDASYDHKYRTSGNTNYVTSYQSPGSLNQTQTYMSDDFFALLDDNEGLWTSSEIVDLSVGRIPVKSTAEADAIVRKILIYGNGQSLSQSPSLSNASNSLGDWRNIATFIADDQDGNVHFRQSDTLANRLQAYNPNLNIEKIYLDAYNQTSTPGGQRYPDAHTAIIDRVQRGTLLVTYTGHGNEVGWAHEHVLEVADINNWSNLNRLPAFLTATCEFTRVDDPGRTSAGEMVFLNPNGGGICLFTTSRLAFASSNFGLSQKFFTHVSEEVNGQMPTIGEVFERTKIEVYADQYVRNFILIGDPALKLAYPKYLVKTNTINGVSINQATDTLKALSKITITGEVQDENNQKLSNFNGVIYPTVFDKKGTYFTLGNDQGGDPSYAVPFVLQKNNIYRGKATVSNGEFSFTFVVPKDIQFAYGNGKLSYYAENGNIDAAGYYFGAVVGGYNEAVTPDNQGPEIKLYMNDEKFVKGGMTDKDPYLYAIVTDSSGINTVGTGIGHDMTGELDKAAGKAVVLNDYFENDLNSYQQGRVKYQFKDLAAGPHTLRFKVWDVHNNSGEASTEFVVAESAELALDHVLNYPNPFTTHTTFMFEHNRPFSQLDVRVQVFTVSGKLVKTISGQIFSEGYRSDDLEWNGLDDFGDKIGKGVYIYKLRVKAPNGEYADKFEKLVILR
ncbi:MAG: type IX secretion system sortase PorU [Bacteroidetes bacterium]|nr:MAG: type IX secretion system sortase PorU [Bacteroidota bacterium]